jgi:hypothetical protein
MPSPAPRFSLVVPTRQRADTLRHALRTLTAQDGRDLEIVVQNNGCDPKTRALVEEIADPRVRHFSSSAILTMSENWEMALRHARGDFITFVGDDDGLFPDACRIARAVFDQTDAKILSWLPFCYYWPNYVHPELRNRLVAIVDNNIRLRTVRSAGLLRRVYRFSADYSELPMIYNSFVARSVIEAVIAEYGRYFLGRAPDVTSGIVNAAKTDQFARLSRPLSMTGLSHHSVGHNTYLAARGRVSQQQTERDIGTSRSDERLVAADNLQVFLAEEMLYVRDRTPSLRQVLDLDYRGLAIAMANAINDRPGSYDEIMTAVQLLMRDHNIDPRVVTIPPRSEIRPAAAWAITPAGPGKVRYVVDGNAEKLATIADAIAWIWSRMPHEPEALALDGSDALPILRPGERMTFAAGAGGTTALLHGWGEPEPWGTWSVESSATLRLKVEGVQQGNLRLGLGYRAFVTERNPSLDVRCRSGGGVVATWRCAAWSGVAELSLSDSAGDGLIELDFEMSEPRSPAELGLSADRRTLGLGLEWLSL